MNDIIWLSWQHHRRNRELSKAFDATLYEIVCPRTNRFNRYVKSIWRTINILCSDTPKVVFCTNPSLLLSLLMVFLKPFFGYYLIIDTHNAGLCLEGKTKKFNSIAKFIQRHSDRTIVHSPGLLQEIRDNNANPILLPDKVPDLSMVVPRNNLLEFKKKVVFICSFEDDEPYFEVFKAIDYIDDKDIIIYITGNYKKKGIDILKYNDPRLFFTGFIPDEDFESLLGYADVIMDLTTRENCLLCGAYEAISLEKPLITSNTDALKENFNKGTVFVNNNALDIAHGINRAFLNINLLRDQMKKLKENKLFVWDKFKQRVENIMKERLRIC